MVALGVLDCLQPVEPLEYRSDQRAFPAGEVLLGETFDPAGDGGLFVGSEHRDFVYGNRWQPVGDQKTLVYQGYRFKEWSTGYEDRRAAMAASATRRGEFLFSPLRVQGWGRIEIINRPYRLHEDDSRKENFGRQTADGPDVLSGDQAPLYVIGVQNPYHALVDLHDGDRFRLEGVPAGTYWLRTFDVHFATVRRRVTIEPGRVTKVELVLDRVKDR